MMSLSLRRLLPLILLNVVVSAAVVLGILLWWDGRQEETPSSNIIPTVVAEATAAGVIPAAGTTPESDGVAESVAVEESQSGGAAEADTGPLVHTVVAGDTLGRISDTYEVSMDDIIAANNLANPNILSVGQELIIPINGVTEAISAPTAEAEGTAAVTAPVVPTPLAAETAAEGESQVQISAVSGVGSLEEEAIEIINNGTAQQSLQGWQLADQDGNLYTFGQVTVFGEGAGILLHSRAGDSNVTNLYWGLDEPAWESGETATLTDAENQVVVTFTVP